MMHLMESFFNIAYLGLVIGLGIRLLLEEDILAKTYGIMAIILGAGDGFHLIPRILAHLTKNGFTQYAASLSWGKFVTSITMTIFYLLFYLYYRQITQDKNKKKDIFVLLLILIRTILVLMPQNLWGGTESYSFSIIRNIPFSILGLSLILWTWKYRREKPLKNVSILIAASFLFYLPVVLFSPSFPLVGILMIPKTIAYVLLVVVGVKYFIPDFLPENLLKTGITYLILGLIGGVFYREFIKVFDWTGPTSLSLVHGHLLALGFLSFLLFYLFIQNSPSYGKIKKPLTLFQIGLGWTMTSFMIRGIYTISSQGTTIFPDAALAGMAGLGHILLGAGLVWTMISINSIRRDSHAIKYTR